MPLLQVEIVHCHTKPSRCFRHLEAAKSSAVGGFAHKPGPPMRLKPRRRLQAMWWLCATLGWLSEGSRKLPAVCVSLRLRSGRVFFGFFFPGSVARFQVRAGLSYRPKAWPGVMATGGLRIEPLKFAFCLGPFRAETRESSPKAHQDCFTGNGPFDFPFGHLVCARSKKALSKRIAVLLRGLGTAHVSWWEGSS